MRARPLVMIAIVITLTCGCDRSRMAPSFDTKAWTHAKWNSNGSARVSLLSSAQTALHEGMTDAEVRELLGTPDKTLEPTTDIGPTFIYDLRGTDKPPMEKDHNSVGDLVLLFDPDYNLIGWQLVKP